MIVIEIQADFFENAEAIVNNELDIDAIESAGFDGKRSIKFILDKSKWALAKINSLLELVYQKDVIVNLEVTKDKISIGRISGSNLKEAESFLLNLQAQIEKDFEK